MNTLFENVLSASFHGSIVILAVLALRLLLRKTPKKFICMLWMLAGLRLLMPFEIQSDLSLQPEADAVAEAVFVSDAYLPMLEDMGVAFPGAPVDPAPDPAAQPMTAAVQEPAMELDIYEGRQDADLVVENDMTWQELLPYIWLAVACGFGVYTLAAYGKLRWQVREAVKIPGGWESDRIDTAFILGFIRPKIYIPMGMSPAVRRHILAHERTHLEKGDHWFKMLGFVALALHWFNPLVWVAYILLCKDIEMACDERVVQFMELAERKEYSAALLSCSTNRIHYGACPVAFGEVSVKTRIKSVLNYRKPGFWISLVGVAAIAFVAVCLLTSPTGEENSPAPADAPVGETREPEKTAPEEAEGFATNLTEDEIIAAVEAGIEELKSRDSYFILNESDTESESEHYGSYRYHVENRRHGENSLNESYENGTLIAGGASLYYEGEFAYFAGDAWVWSTGEWSNPDYHPNDWLDSYSPGDKTITFPEGSGVIDGNTVSFAAAWTENNPWERSYAGTYTVTFLPDGTISSLTRQYTYIAEDDGAVHYTNTLTVQSESPDEIDRKIRSAAESAVTAGEVETIRREAQMVTEIPSNKTDYDKDFMLGSGEMGWQMMDGEWFFKFGAVNVSETGATLKVEHSGPYGNNTVTGGTVTAGTGYFLEEMVDGTWVTLEPKAGAVPSIPEKTLKTGSTQAINWENTYGSLPGGFYRIGNHYTFTSNTGEMDTVVCYAKFRLYDPNHEKLLAQCREAVEALLNADSYHLYTFDYLIQLKMDYYLSTDVWKQGKDFLQISRYPLRADMTRMHAVNGSMWRDGKYYGLEWEDTDVSAPVTDWWVGVDGYMDNSNFSMWSWDFAWYDANVELVYQEGNTIRVIQNYDFDEQYACTELTFTFDDGGDLKGIVYAYLPTRNAAQKDKVISNELVVFDTGAEEIGALIDSQDVQTPMAFDYASDVKNNPDAQTGGFKNTTEKPITTAAEAAARADRESTMPRILNFDNGYLQTRTYRDEAAGMWKVELFWWQHDTMQTVYMNDNGVTQMIVSQTMDTN